MGKSKKNMRDLCGSGTAGVLRSLGFIVLIVATVPVHYFYKYILLRDPLMVPIYFHKIFLKIAGFKIRTHGDLPDISAKNEFPTLFVSNHTSYLDIPVLGSLIKGSFVAKSEVADWPVMGFLAKLQNSVFIERRALRAAEQTEEIVARLAKGDNLILFPEGTSTDGNGTLPFKSSLFSVAYNLPCRRTVRVQPVSVLFTEICGLPACRAWKPYYAWYGDMTFVKHLWNVLRIGGYTVDVIFHPAVSIDDFGDRKKLSEHCQKMVASGVERCNAGRVYATL